MAAWKKIIPNKRPQKEGKYLSKKTLTRVETIQGALGLKRVKM